MKIKKFFKSKAGFTLIELLVVIGIIAVLATIGTISFGAASAKARDAKRAADLRTIASALEVYNADNPANEYPVTADADTWATFTALIRVSGIMPPSSEEDYCYFSNSAANPTSYVVMTTDYEKTIPDNAASFAAVGTYAIRMASDDTTGVVSACENKVPTGITVVTSCTAAGTTTGGVYCITGGT